MKPITFTIFLLLLPLYTYSQEFSFSLHFEDAVGNKDTLIFGYDRGATDGTDLIFGEENLHYQSFHPEFEVRIGNASRYEYLSDTILLKKQIERKKCNEKGMPLIQSILVKCKHFPLKISWDSFNNACVSITDWDPGCWFDCVMGGEQGPFYLKGNTSIILSYINRGDFDYRGDPLQVLYFTLASEDHFKTITGLPEIGRSNPLIYPNPVEDLFYINDQANNDEIQYVQMKDMTGRIVIKSLQNPFSVAHLPKGFYLLGIYYKNTLKPIISKIVKK